MSSSKRPRVGDVEQKLKTFMGPDGGLLADHAAAFCKLMATQGSEVSSCASLDAMKKVVCLCCGLTWGVRWGACRGMGCLRAYEATCCAFTRTRGQRGVCCLGCGVGLRTRASMTPSAGPTMIRDCRGGARCSTGASRMRLGFQRTVATMAARARASSPLPFDAPLLTALYHHAPLLYPLPYLPPITLTPPPSPTLPPPTSSPPPPPHRPPSRTPG